LYIVEKERNIKDGINNFLPCYLTKYGFRSNVTKNNAAEITTMVAPAAMLK
jgi:hypothetical protein